ncbi:hypothetical protein [Henriciella sp.]|uniref:tetratricopeptide repeat protein n=1 Tax=Henriciella sp. TaxID=1968823 RepID=UPI002611657E|nr:hypothetical protein [Henriciella sp.]
MKYSTALLATAAVSTLGACEGTLMPSEYAYLNTTPQMVEQWLAECEGNETDMLRKARHCELAEKSIEPGDPDYGFVKGNLGYLYYKQEHWGEAERAYSDAIAAGAGGEMYGNRGLARSQLGAFDAAMQDYRTAYEQTGDAYWQEEMQWLDYALADAIEYRVFYTGFGCRRVQDDSVFDAPNEVSIHLVAADALSSTATSPDPPKGFQNVTAGTFRAGERDVITVGALQPFTLSVMMWEIDDGGDAIDLTVMYGQMLASGGRGRDVRYAGRTVNVAKPEGGSSPSPTPVHNAISSTLKSAFGTENDYMGGFDFTDMVASEIAMLQPRVERGIPYHFKSDHRQGGADCSAYFVVREIPMSDESYINVVNSILDGDPS